MCARVLRRARTMEKKKALSCNSSLSERIFNHKICHTLVKIPLTSLVPAGFLLWCS